MLVRRLLQETGAALARQDLHQIASLPGGSETPQATKPEARWLFEVPFLTPQGPAVAQFEISRDAPQRKDAGAETGPTWRARFSINLEPAGPVHAELAMRGGQARVTLWAERPETAARLNAESGELVGALARADCPAEVACRPGAPQAPAAPAGRFLDRAT